MFQSALRSFSRPPVDSHVLYSLGSKRPCRFSRYYYAPDITKQSFSSSVAQAQNEATTHSEAPPAASEGISPASVTNRTSNDASVDEQLEVVSKNKSKKKRKKNKREGPTSSPTGFLKGQERLNAKDGKGKRLVLGKMTSPRKLSAHEERARRSFRGTSESAGPSWKRKHSEPNSKSEKIHGLSHHISENHTGTISSMGQDITALDVETAPVPNLSFGLDRVIFNPGVYHLRDPRTRIYNFDPYLDNIMPVSEFDFEALKEYITSSKDEYLIQLARDYKKKYVGSSSSMTGVLSHFHYLLSEWRPVNRKMVSQGFPEKMVTFTRLLRSPAAMFLHYKDGVYAIDADKEFDSANILMNLGKSMEKLLTLPKEEFERYRKSSENKISAEDEQAIPEAYHYSTIGDFIMRSQLDGYDPRLPGTGMFDLKTRAVVSIRMDVRNFRKGMGYEIKNRFGMWESYEREYYDMIRAAFLKYSLQVRVGRMDGIFVAFHNIERIFGFQYIPLSEMDLALHGQEDPTLGDREFQFSLKLWNTILDKATAKFPGKSLRLHFETQDGKVPFMRIFAEPVTNAEIKAIQEKNKDVIEKLQRELLNPELVAKDEEEAAAQAAELEDEQQAEIEAEIEAPDAAEVMAEREQDVIVSTDSGTISENAASSSSPDESTTQRAAGNTDGDDPRMPPLMGMTLSITNRINAKKQARPSELKPTDTWEMDYELCELKNNSYLYTTYKQVKKRRSNTLAFRGEDENFYIRELRRMAEAGRVYRAEQDQLDKEKGISVYEPVTSVSQNSVYEPAVWGSQNSK